LLNEFLLRSYGRGENAALIIDEAQNLSSDVLESVRLLSNFETTKDKLLQILLVGQPELNNRLNAPELRQLKQRITLRHHLRPLLLNDCQEYIASRLKHAGGSTGLFTPRAIEAIHHYSGGIPRLVNVICDNAMITAYALDQRQIEPALIREVAEDLHLSGTAVRPVSVRRDVMPRLERALPQTEVAKPQSIQLVKSNRAVPMETGLNGVPISQVVSQESFVWLREALVDAMGPMAHIVLAEHVKLLGGSLDHFPRDRVNSLIDSVSREIFDQSIRRQFCQSMSAKINQLEKV
jgi:hypothetical protein